MDNIKNQEVHVFFANKNVIAFHQPKVIFLKQLQSNLKKNPNNIELQTVLAQVYYKYDNDYKSALVIIRNILLKDPLSLDARIDLIEIMLDFELGTQNECQAQIDECFLIDKDYWRIHFVQIRLYDCMNLNDSFIGQQMKQVLLKFPDNVWLKMYNLQIVSDKEDFQLLKIHEKCLSDILSSKYLDFDVLRRLAYFQNSVNKNELVLDTLNQALKLNSRSYNCLNNYGFFQRTHLNKNSECIEYCYKALAQNPRSVTTLQNVGYTYQKMLKYDQSTQYFKKCIEIKRYRPCQYQNIISNYFEKGDYQTALYFAKKGLQQFPHCPILNVYCQEMMLQCNAVCISDKELYESVSFKTISSPMYYGNEDDYRNINDAFNLIFSEDIGDEIDGDEQEMADDDGEDEDYEDIPDEDGE